MLIAYSNSCHIIFWPFYMKHVLNSNNQAECTYYVFFSLLFILFKMVKCMVRMSTSVLFTETNSNGNGKDGLFAWILIGDACKYEDVLRNERNKCKENVIFDAQCLSCICLIHPKLEHASFYLCMKEIRMIVWDFLLIITHCIFRTKTMLQCQISNDNSMICSYC